MLYLIHLCLHENSFLPIIKPNDRCPVNIVARKLSNSRCLPIEMEKTKEHNR